MPHYPCEVPLELQHLLDVSQRQQAQIETEKINKPTLWETIRFKLTTDWTYNSNAIEGSAMTFGDTLFFLQEGLTVQGKPLKDHLDAQNHAEAVDILFEIVNQDRPISQRFIKEINALLLNGIKSTPAMTPDGRIVQKPATPGQYKKQPNHVLQPDRSLHLYVDPVQVENEMEHLIQWIAQYTDMLPAPFVAAIAHYNMVRIHPFDDGNGRGARILMNIILMKKGFIPAVIRNEQKQTYYQTLRLADNGNLIPFVQFVTQHLLKTQEDILHDLQI